MAGLQVGRALGCSGYLGLGSALPVPPPPSPCFLGTQPPYATKALNDDDDDNDYDEYICNLFSLKFHLCSGFQAGSEMHSQF